MCTDVGFSAQGFGILCSRFLNIGVPKGASGMRAHCIHGHQGGPYMGFYVVYFKCTMKVPLHRISMTPLLDGYAGAGVFCQMPQICKQHKREIAGTHRLQWWRP